MANLKDTSIDGNLSVNGTIGTTSSITGNNISSTGQLSGSALKTNAITALSGGTSGQISINSDINMNTKTLFVNTINKIGNGTITINKGLYIPPNNPSTFDSSIFTTTYPHNLGYHRFQGGAIGMYNSCTDAKNGTNRKGFIESDVANNRIIIKQETGGYILLVSTSGNNNNFLTWQYDLYPNSNGVPYLGLANYKWKAVYSTNGSIQTSDRSAKSDIHYIDNPKPKIRTMSLSNNTTDTSFTSEDLITFIKKLNPATFVYGDGTVDEALNSNNTEAVQLGLIADDIKDEPLFNYVGATSKYDKVIEPEERDEDGNITKEAVTEKATTLGLKPIPLAVLALSACKKLIERVEALESKTN